MGDSSIERKRRTFRWSAKARDLANANLATTGNQLRKIVTQLVEITGNPRSACRRFIYRMGNKAKFRYKDWSASEQEHLLELLDEHSVASAARQMRRSKSALYGMLRRLKMPAGMRQSWLSKRTLAQLLQVHVRKVDSWIESGSLKATVIQVGKVTRTVIKTEDFVQFCKENRDLVIGNRLNSERLEFLYTFVFSPDHNHLLSVRKHKKERTAVADEPRAPDSPQEPNADPEDPLDDVERTSNSLASDNDAALECWSRIDRQH
jgi:polyhydroxyalkanoate synthesis regulator phasin